MVNALRMANTVANQKNARENAEASLRFWYPGDHQQRQASLAAHGHVVPGRTALTRSRARLDIACMLEWRERYAEMGPSFRYISVDASPRPNGLEAFVQVERVILAADIFRDGHPDVQQRVMPLVVLGHGRCGLADKVQAAQHQTWLEYGPSVERVRQANLDVRQVLTDMGTEVGIADFGDTTEECFGSGQPVGAVEACHPRWLYPLALYIPGPQHIINVVLKDAVESLPWWPAWSSSAKSVCQWLSNAAHRLWLQARLERIHDGHPEVSDMKKSLDLSLERFAHWRWDTLQRATRSLLRVEKVVRLLMQDILSPSELGTRDEGVAKSVLVAIQDSTFWSRARGLNFVLRPLHDLAAWIRGCDCHEEELKAKKVVICKWKGCRAASISDRLMAATRDILEIRESAGTDGVPGLDTPAETIQTMTAMLGIFELKFEWAHGPPYSIWKVAASPAQASQFLKDFDEAIQEGRQPNRVSCHFCSKGSSLRAAMEQHAAGEGISDKLRQELMAYQLCALDDSWVEGSHRDITSFEANRRNAKWPYLGASMRMKQNLSLWDTAVNQGRMVTFFRKHKAIGHPRGRTRPNRGVTNQKSKSKKQVISDVYRLGTAALVNWAARFEGVHCQSPLSSLDSPPTLKAMTKLKKEYLELAIKDTCSLYSLPLVNLEGEEAARNAESMSDALAILDRESAGKQILFSVLGIRARRAKAIRSTKQQQRIARMCCPVTIQEYSLATRAAASCDVANGSLVYPSCSPRVVDLIFFAGWATWRSGLRRWSECGSADGQPGCLVLGNPSLVHETAWNFREASQVPLVVLLDHLVNLGWQNGKLKEHTKDSQKVMAAPKSSNLSVKPYLQCLACLEDILSDAFPALVTGQPPTYYSCVLAVANPERILLDQPAAYYAKLWQAAGKSLGEEGTLAPEDFEMDNRDVAQANLEMDEVEDFPIESSTVTQGVGKPRPTKKKTAVADDVDNEESALWRPPKRAKPPVIHPAASATHEKAPRVQYGGSSSSASAPIAVSAEASLAKPASTRKGTRDAGPSTLVKKSTPREIADILEGCNIYKENHLEPGQPGHYVRLVAECMFRGCGHDNCERKRSIPAGNTKVIGEKEPFAFLGCWLEAAVLYDNREGHMKHQPSKTDIQAYALKMGWTS